MSRSFIDNTNLNSSNSLTYLASEVYTSDENEPSLLKNSKFYDNEQFSKSKFDHCYIFYQGQQTNNVILCTFNNGTKMYYKIIV